MKVGIVCDNHKKDEYVNRLNKAGFMDLTVSDLGPACKTISIEIGTSDKKAAIGSICNQVEEFFRKPARHKYA